MVHLCRKKRCLVMIRELEREAGFVGIRKLAQSWTFMFVIMQIVTIMNSGPISVSRQNRIVNRVEKYVTETTETIEDEEHRAFGIPIAKARTRMKSTMTLTPVSVKKVGGRQSGKL